MAKNRLILIRPPKLTQKQWAVYDLIKEFVSERGFPPTRTEIAQTLGYKSVNAACTHVTALIRKGALQSDRGIARGLRLCETGWPWDLKTSQGERMRLVWKRAD